MGMRKPLLPPALPPPPPILHEPQGELAQLTARKRGQAAGGFESTIKTSPEGVTTPAKTTQATLLGGL